MKAWLRGFRSAIDLFPTHPSFVNLVPKRTDSDALRSDWEKIGKDIGFVINKIPSGEIKRKIA